MSGRHFSDVDRHIASGRAGRVAIECGQERITYQHVVDSVNLVGTALRDGFGVRCEERVLLMVDGPDGRS